MKEFDVVVLGAGPGGYSLANILSSNGKKVALIERKHFGGTCVNEGCISTKTLIKSAKVLETLKHSKEYGILTKDADFDLQEIQNRRQVNKEILNGAIKASIENAGVEIFFGEGEVIDKNTLSVNGEMIKTDKLVLATGARSRDLDIEGYKDSKSKGFIIDSTDALYLNKKPESFTIIGSGPVGLEFAYFYSTLGSKVTILEAGKFMNNFDIDLQETVKSYFIKRNVNIIENAKIEKFIGNNIEFEVNGKKGSLLSEKILVAAGRVANNDSFKSLNLELNKNGSVKVNNKMETSVKGVYALGDVTGILMLSTVAYKTADIIAKEILKQNSEGEIFEAKQIPWSVYLNPEFSGVGFTEQELKSRNIEFNIIKIPTSALPRAYADNLEKELGFIKFLVSKNDGQILGSFMFAEGSHLIINEIALAISNKISFMDLQKNPFTHPTVAEAVYYGSRNYVFSKK
ncbi:dihydrolipoamide dehydrogenase [Mycoplasmopsis canis PG 14]|uniref:Thioredoxin reductase n=1 Tax=Mycoplasmopsis canis TaxID=29555 RepID=A0A449AQV0_9BACT|nr:dihydrolipoyl dehydrogenase [Mycoplasmopsis canis]AMD81282.1 dihydrolipoamide dehydrogenase [Mycoplasmopsis canis PG 14]EIE40577.1 dihydrolipoamide dehydrogenase [Mycoplasmopsis canis PG 14]VEU68746.1 thioredoxin reductase [Mycoplasmopsis canis]